jgi:hypothetical protein
MSVVSYDGKKLIPAPRLQISRTANKKGDGSIIGFTYQLVLTGDLIAYKGSPNSLREFWDQSGYPPDEAIEADSRLGALLRKQEALRNLFSAQGRELYIQSADGSEPLKCNPRINDISFAEGIWFDRITYTINMEADVVYPIVEGDFPDLISDATEEWNIETDEGAPEGLGLPRTYRLTHTVGAVGKLSYNELGGLTSQAWENARAYVIPRLGMNNSFLLSSGVSDLPSYYGGYNHSRTEAINIAGGGYNITETWLLASGSALEDFTIQITSNAESNRQNVKINGTVTGLELRSSNLSVISNKFTNAETKFNAVSGLAYSRCQTYSGYDLNIYPMSESIGKNPIAGTISYDFEYDNRPYNLIPGAIAERITINDTLPNQLVAVIPILGRAAGPILQPINTSAELTRTLSVEFTLRSKIDMSDLAASFNTLKPTALVDVLKDAADPIVLGSESYVQSDRETWEPITGRYSREIIWIYQ